MVGSRLPPVSRLVDRTLGEGRSPKSVRGSLDVLLKRRSTLEKYSSVEELALSEDPEDERERSAIQHHMMRLRGALLRELWSHEYFIGASVVDSILFYVLRDGGMDAPLRQFFAFIRDRGLHRPGLVVYPIHSFGLLGAGLLVLRPEKQRPRAFLVSEGRFAVSAQTNSFESSLLFVRQAAAALGVKHRIPDELMRHWNRSRPLKWFTVNPILVARTHSFPGEYYENQALILAQLTFATSAMYALGVAQQPKEGRAWTRFSTSEINNFETLDFRHYLVLHAPGRGGRELEGQCVPMNAGVADLEEASELGIEIDPKQWGEGAPRRAAILSAMKEAQGGYFRYALGRLQDSPRARFFRKVFDSLSYFRRSFRRSAHPGEAAVNLATAFETLLTDRWSPPVTATISFRLSVLLAGCQGARGFNKLFAALYDARSKAVHTGERTADLDMVAAQRMFVDAFASFAGRFKSMNFRIPNPIEAELGSPNGKAVT